MKTSSMLRVSLREMLLIVALAGTFCALYRERQISRPIREAVEIYRADKARPLSVGSNFGPPPAHAVYDGLGITVRAMDMDLFNRYMKP